MPSRHRTPPISTHTERRYMNDRQSQEVIAMATGFEDHCWKDIVTPEMLKIYKNYERDVYVGERPVLVLVDLYNCVFEGGNRPVAEIIDEFPNSCGEHAWNAVPNILSLIGAAREARI